jgi:hypothetical protein
MSSNRGVRSRRGTRGREAGCKGVEVVGFLAEIVVGIQGRLLPLDGW